MLKALYLIFIPAILLWGCCRPGENLKGAEALNIEVGIKEINSWVNLMPGTGEPSFHVTADFEILNKEDHSLNELIVDKIEMILDSKRFVLSGIDIKSQVLDTGLKQGTAMNFKINARKTLNEKLTIDKPLIMNFYFLSESKMYKFEATDIKIEKVY